jgi:hypothetical protein
VAFYPCDAGPHYNPRKNFLFYAGYGAGNDFDRYRLRFCAAHYRTIQEDLSEFEVSPEDGAVSGGDTAMTNCLACGEPVDQTGRNLFATCYPTKDERKDYWARIHVDCRLPVWLRDQQAQKV